MFNIVLYQPEIPPNTGNIARLCAGVGAKLHLIKPLGFDINEKEVRRAGLDYWDKVDVKVWDDWEEFSRSSRYDSTKSNHSMSDAPISECPEGVSRREGARYFLTTKTDKKYTDVKFEKNDYLIFGPETKGLPEDLLNKNKENCLTIPMKRENIRSINLSNSVAIVLYEAIRQINMI